MIDRRTILLGAMLAGSAAGLAGCSGKDSTDGRLTVGLTYIPNIQFSAFYVGVEKQIFADHGLEVTLRHHGQQEDIFGALLRGDEQVVFASADEAMVAAANGNDLRTFATSYQHYPLNIIGLDGSVALPAQPLQVLAGRRLGIPGHFGSSFYGALCAIHTAGLSQSDVTLVDIGYTALSALETRKVDFVVAFSNNELVQLQTRGKSPLALPVTSQSEPNLIGPSLVTRANSVPPATLKALAAALAQAEQAVIDDPEAAIGATAAQVPALSDPTQRLAAAKVLDATTRLWLVDGKPSVALNTAAFGRMGEFLVRAGVIDKAPENPFAILS